jgi:hypothetical protein
MRVQSLIDPLMTPQASHRKRVVEMNMVPTQKTQGRIASLGVLAPPRHQTILAHLTHPEGVGEGLSGLLSKTVAMTSVQLAWSRLG